ncbi:hypothetical protein P4V41_07685 [Fictibacillus nanhaiensis]|uniref:hypothetical protein n=1 Tax=Fictibacillus nanhaiensis TaxID=742169 RepID=UPI002E21C8D1|nr:hypothetical protein [Fictibacillus nanhaiensis]
MQNISTAKSNIGFLLKKIRGKDSQLRVSMKLKDVLNCEISREAISAYENYRAILPYDIYMAYGQLYGNTQLIKELGQLLGYTDETFSNLCIGDRVAIKQNDKYRIDVVSKINERKSIILKFSKLSFNFNGVLVDSNSQGLMIVPVTNEVLDHIKYESLLKTIENFDFKKLSKEKLKRVMEIVNE